MTLREVLQQVYERNNALTPIIVVDEARNGTDAVSQYLRDRLTWDDEEAGEQWRLHEARKLIQRAYVTYEPQDGSSLREIRAFVAVPKPSRSYRPIKEVAADPMASKIMLADAARQWHELEARYGHLQEFVEIVERDVAKMRRRAAHTRPRRRTSKKKMAV